jgi:hypothetical protein
MAERAGPLTSALLAAAQAGERERQGFAATVDAERLAGAAALAAQLAEAGGQAAGLGVERARDLIWLTPPPTPTACWCWNAAGPWTGTSAGSPPAWPPPCSRPARPSRRRAGPRG